LVVLSLIQELLEAYASVSSTSSVKHLVYVDYCLLPLLYDWTLIRLSCRIVAVMSNVVDRSLVSLGISYDDGIVWVQGKAQITLPWGGSSSVVVLITSSYSIWLSLIVSVFLSAACVIALSSS